MPMNSPTSDRAKTRRTNRPFGRLLAWFGAKTAPADDEPLQSHDRATLTAFFRALGCDDPESWADSQIEEGINHLGRVLFVRSAWAQAVPPHTTDWIDNVLRNHSPETDLGATWRRVLASGAARSDIAAIVRAAEGEMIFSICRLLEDPDETLIDQPVRWGLFAFDDEDRCLGQVRFPHEDVFSLDPARGQGPDRNSPGLAG